jgi:putative transposase
VSRLVVPALLFSSVDPPCSISLVVEMIARATPSVIRKRIKEIAQVRVRYGYQRIYVLLRREGWRDNHKRVYRVYCEEGLHLRSKRPRRNRAAAHRLERPQLSSIHQCWSMDFVADQLFDSRKIRSLTIRGRPCGG